MHTDPNNVKCKYGQQRFSGLDDIASQYIKYGQIRHFLKSTFICSRRFFGKTLLKLN